MRAPRQREVWLAHLDPIEGHEQAGTRPVVVISRDAVNESPWGLCVCVPLTTRDRGSPLHVEIEPPEGGVKSTSFALTDQVRTLDQSRLTRRWGEIEPATHVRIASILVRTVAPR